MDTKIPLLDFLARVIKILFKLIKSLFEIVDYAFNCYASVLVIN